MRPWSTLLLILLVTAVLPVAATAQEMLARPEIADYETPDWQARHQQTQPHSLAREYLDVALLAAACAAASYLALVKRSRRGLFVLTILSLVWFGFVRKGCVCPIGAIQNVALALFDPTYLLPLGVLLLFALPIVFTLFLGRTFCAAVCPLGAIQELVAVRPVKVPGWLDHSLGLLAYVYLGLAVLFAATGTAFVICEYDPFVGLFRLSASANMLILGGCFLLVGVFIGRPYCRYLCPLGAVFRLISPLSKWHVRIPPEDCINCRLCEDACPYGAIREPTVPQSAEERLKGRRRLLALLVVAPLLMLLCAGLGRMTAVPLAWLDPTVRLAERVSLEQKSAAVGNMLAPTDASDAFRTSGRPPEELVGEALQIRSRFRFGATLLGVWVGLVVAGKLIQLSIRRTRQEYEPDKARCVSCGRCFWYCPQEQARQGWIEEPAALARPMNETPQRPVMDPETVKP